MDLRTKLCIAWGSSFGGRCVGSVLCDVARLSPLDHFGRGSCKVPETEETGPVTLINASVPRRPALSTYSLRQKLRMASWWAVEALLFRPSLHKMNGWRCFLLRMFGAEIGRNTFIFSGAKIWFPWNLERLLNWNLAVSTSSCQHVECEIIYSPAVI